MVSPTAQLVPGPVRTPLPVFGRGTAKFDARPVKERSQHAKLTRETHFEKSQGFGDIVLVYLGQSQNYRHYQPQKLEIGRDEIVCLQR